MKGCANPICRNWTEEPEPPLNRILCPACEYIRRLPVKVEVFCKICEDDDNEGQMTADDHMYENKNIQSRKFTCGTCTAVVLVVVTKEENDGKEIK